MDGSQTRDAVFVSYRRADSAGWAGRISDQLTAHLGADRVFVDVGSIRPGADFTEAIDRALERAAAVVVVIGPDWVGISDDAGRPRLADGEDLVAVEVRRALGSGAVVLPVLVDGAAAPTVAQLPDELAGLATRQALHVRPDSFAHDVDRLVRAVDDAMPVGARAGAAPTSAAPTTAVSATAAAGGDGARTRLLLAGVAVALLAVLGAAFLGRGDDDPVIADPGPTATPTAVPTDAEPSEAVEPTEAVEPSEDVEPSEEAEPTEDVEVPPLLPLLERAPNPGDSFRYVLSQVDLSGDADVWDIDWEESTDADLAELDSRGAHAICYVSAGSWESFRGDAEAFPEVVLGEPLGDFPDERWLDVRRQDVLRPIIAARLDTCAAKGFDSVEFDNTDGYGNDTGFELTEQDAVAWIETLAALARERGLSPGLKNSLAVAGIVEPLLDWLLVEECIEFDECDLVEPFVDAGKAVFVVAYATPVEVACDHPVNDVATVIVSDRDLSGDITPC